MLAPKVASAQGKTAKAPVSRIASQRPAGLPTQLSLNTPEQARLVQRTIGNQAMLRLLSRETRNPATNQPVMPSLESGPPSNFARIPVVTSGHADRTQPGLPLTAAPFPGILQPKLEIGAVDDPLEAEADRVADAVVQGKSIQRKCAACEEEESELHRARIADGQGGAPTQEIDGQGGAPTQDIDGQDGEHAELLQRSGAKDTPVPADLSQQITGTLGGGQALPEATRRDLGGRMGADFSHVRIHTDPAAADMCHNVGAHAFTVGQDIYFNHGLYNPQSHAGVHLLAHELTHTMQQAGTIRRLSITPTKTFTTGKCGQRSVYWNFASGVAAPASGGYIVQHVRNMETSASCPDTVEAVSTTPKNEFWEAWWVGPGDKIQLLHKQGVVDYTDNSKLGAADGAGKSQHQASRGEVKFFGKDTTGDLGKEDVVSSDPAIAAVWKPGTKGGVARSGWLPSTPSQPSWWGNSLDGPENRWANSWWNCCDADESKQWSKSDASPK
jgi:Domain of unknown function (DUF4157)